MADKLIKIFDASHSSKVSECVCIGKEVGQAVKSFRFLWPRHCTQSSCPCAPLRVQCPGDPDFKSHGEVSSKPRSSKSADAITPDTDTGMCKDVDMSHLRVLKDAVSPHKDLTASRKYRDGMDIDSVNNNLTLIVENKEPGSASDLDSPTEIFHSQLKKRRRSSLLDTDGAIQESMFRGEKMESVTWDYAGRETSKNERLLLQMKCLQGQLHRLVAMQSNENRLKAGNRIEKESAYFDASIKISVCGSADLVGPQHVGQMNARSVSCIDMEGGCSFASGVIEAQAATSVPCHSMCMHDIQEHLRQRYIENTTSNVRDLDSFFDDGCVRASNGSHMKPISSGKSVTMPSYPGFLHNSCTTEISNLSRSIDHQYESERTVCDSQRVPKLAHVDPPDQTILRPFKCSRVEKYFNSETDIGVKCLERSCELQEKALQSDCDKKSDPESVQNKSAASSPPVEGPSDAAKRGVSSHGPEKEVAFEESNKENRTDSAFPKENGGHINTDAESLGMNKEKRPSFSDAFIEGREVRILETNDLHGEDLCCHAKPRMLGSEVIAQTMAPPEPSSRWVKRLQPCSLDSFALGTNSFSVEYHANSGQVQKLFTRVLNYSRSNSSVHLANDEQKDTGTSMSISVNGRDSPVELLKRSYPWIRRWCHTSQEQGHRRLPSEAQSYTRRETQVPCQGGIDGEKQFPSVGAMALMGKAAINFRPCEYRRKGPFIVWNTNGTLQE